MNTTVFAVHAAFIRGVEAVPVTVEVSIGGGLPSIALVGSADSTVGEGRGRIRCAFRSTGFTMPRGSITVNLAPSDIRKTGTGLDLPIAVAILAQSGQIPVNGLDTCLFVGELALDGRVNPVKGTIAYQMLARSMNLKLVVSRSQEGESLPDAAIYPLDNIGRLRGGAAKLDPSCVRQACAEAKISTLDYADVIGQEIAKRGMAIAATGGLGLLMIGAPGSGKTMLARRLTTILPDMNAKEQQEALCVHSVAGEDLRRLITGERPFRSPHHSISTAGLIGGGRPVRPGEITLAHGGCLFLDELAEFPASVLQSLRQPLEEGCVRIVRVDGMYVFPSRFQLIAASNPCPCGYLGDKEVPCSCSAAAIERYRSKLAGPLMDRIDIIIDVARPDPTLIVEGSAGMNSHEMRDAVTQGRTFAAWRGARCESASHAKGLDTLDGAVSTYRLDGEATDALVAIARSNNLTGRGIKRLCRIARTIADMDESIKVTAGHVLEGSMYQGRRAS